MADRINQESPQSCWAKFDIWVWNSGHFTRDEKTRNHLRGNRLVNNNFLFVVRVIMLVTFAVAESHHFYYNIVEKKRYRPQFLTI